jgi:serine/threonine protein phosphatase PrpC
VCDELMRLALAAGAPDNVTCIVARANGALPEPDNSLPKLDKVALPVKPF